MSACSQSRDSGVADTAVFATNIGDKGAASGEISAEMAAEVREKLDALLGEYGESVAVLVAPLGGEEIYAKNESEAFVSASMIKLLILAEYMRCVDEGSVVASEVYTVQAKDIVGGTGSIQNEGAGVAYTYDELAHLMIAHSDNVATNILIDTLGMDAINAEAERIGLADTRLNRKMMDLQSGVENYISARDAQAILAGIALHDLASEVQCQTAEGYLLDQTDKDGLATGLRADVPFGHKTGSLTAVRHDGGIVYAEKPYVLVVLTSLGADEANALMESIAQQVSDVLG